MAVPAHDERDFEFAQKFDLPVREVVEGGDVTQAAYTEDGTHVNSGFLNGMDKAQAIEKMIDWLEENQAGERKVNYKLRDWTFSRQRYWGEPIPVIHWEDGETTLVPEEELPLTLPKTSDIKPSGTGESPLARIEDWLNVVDENGRKGRRETNTMPQWAGSSWYYLRYIDPHNEEKLADYDKLKQWLPVDLYIGGAEHAVLHLLYARFWHKFLYDIGVVPTPEPFQKLFNQGLILGANHEKMSKSKGNGVNPDDVVQEYGADALRMYELFMGPLDASTSWAADGPNSTRRFLDRVWRLIVNEETHELSKKIVDAPTEDLDKIYHQTVKKVTEDFEALHFNTAISQMMVFVNEANKAKALNREMAEGFVKLLAPIAPHMMEEIWQVLGHNDSISYEPWPTFDESKLVEDTVEMIIQINGKLKSKMMVSVEATKETIEKQALADETIQAQIGSKEIRKMIVVPQKNCEYCGLKFYIN